MTVITRLLSSPVVGSYPVGRRAAIKGRLDHALGAVDTALSDVNQATISSCL